MRGRGHKRAAEKAFQRWRKLHFDALCDGRLMPTPTRATLRLPVHVLPSPSASSPSLAHGEGKAAATVDVHLSTNHHGIAAWWKDEYDTFLCPSAVPDADTPVAASTRIAAHVGPPAAPLGYPAYIAAEAQQWTDGVLRGEAYAYANAEAALHAPPPPPAGSRYLSPVRWLEQPLMDGVVAQRLVAHAGVTTAAMLEARRAGAALGQLLPPFQLSPFYAASDLRDRWCLFGDAAAVVPSQPAGAAPAAPVEGGSSDLAADHHHRRVADLALAAAVLPNYGAVWLNGAVVTHVDSGRSVLIVGPRRSGKTTLALHCVTSSEHGGDERSMPRVRLTAAEQVFIGAGTAVERVFSGTAPPAAASSSLPRLPRIFACALPHRLSVGLGAVLGTLRPNPPLAAAVALPPFLRTESGVRAFLANSDERIWHMSLRYNVRLQDVCNSGDAAAADDVWQPAVVSGLAGVVLLDWDVDELAHSAPAVSSRTRVRRLPLHQGGLEALLTRGRDFLFHAHHLVRGVCGDGAAAEGPERLAGVLAAEWTANAPADAAAAPALHSIEGSVDFDAATKLVLDLLLSGQRRASGSAEEDLTRG